MKTTIGRYLRHYLAAAALCFSGSMLAPGCAATSASTTPAGPVELNGTRWKLAVSGGRFDGRVVEFKKKGKDGYLGNLVEAGNRLRDVVGLQMGTMVFSVRKKSETEYEGLYKDIAADGQIAEQEVVIFINGDMMTWNLGSASWERQQ